MASGLATTEDIGIISKGAGSYFSTSHFTASRLKRNVLRLIGKWQQSNISLLAYTLIIATVAIYDISLTIKYAPSLAQLEVNPIGRWLMDIRPTEIHFLTAPSGMYLFLQLKGLGTVVVIAVIHGLIRWRLDMGQAVAFGVSLFQLWLAAYLTFR